MGGKATDDGEGYRHSNSTPHLPAVAGFPPPQVGRISKEQGSLLKKFLSRELRKNPTDTERTLWKHLRYRQIKGRRFRRQHPIGPFVVDFICLEKKIIIEVDGSQHQKNAEYDSERTKWLEIRGYKVVRFWNNEIMKEMDAVLKVIGDALN